MRLKINRVDIKGLEGTKIIRPNQKVIDPKDLENYRKSLQRDESDIVRFHTEEVEG